jgi:hypothetical protein
MQDSSVTKGEEGGESGRRIVAKATRFSLEIIRESEFRMKKRRMLIIGNDMR